MSRRTYRLQARAESQNETRQRIVEAAIQLHQEVGPAFTSVTDIADRAGVGRVTVYRHFPDETALLRACGGQYAERHPLPDVSATRRIADPAARLRAALFEVYAYHRETEPMMGRVLPQVGDQPIMQPYHAHFASIANDLTTPFKFRGRRRTLLRAGIVLALSFDTWRLLVREQSLPHGQAIDIVIRLTSDSPAPG